jgi:hypothetical protein
LASSALADRPILDQQPRRLIVKLPDASPSEARLIVRGKYRSVALLHLHGLGEAALGRSLADLPAINVAKVLKQFEKHLISVGIVGM